MPAVGFAVGDRVGTGYGGEIIAYAQGFEDRKCGRLRFVGADSHGHALCLEGAKDLDHAVIYDRVIRRPPDVAVQEPPEDAFRPRCPLAAGRRQGPFDQFPRPLPDHSFHLLDRERRPAGLGQGPVQ